MRNLNEFIDQTKLKQERSYVKSELFAISDFLQKDEVCVLEDNSGDFLKELKDSYKSSKDVKDKGNPSILMNYVGRNKKVDTSKIDSFYYTQYTSNDTVLDRNWMKNRFMSSNSELDEYNLGRYFTPSIFKISNTGLGGHLCCNTKHQFTRYADIRHPKQYLKNTEMVKIEDYNTDYGLGRYYSDAIDDNAQLVYLQFGVPEFNGILDFLFNSVDYKESVLANTGRKPTMYNIAYTIGTVIGVGALFACFPFLTVAWIGSTFLVKFLRDRTNFNYYYMQPTMYSYWGTVNTILNQMATELRITKPVLNLDNHKINDPNIVGTPVDQMPDESIDEALREMLGRMYDRKTGYLSAFNIAAASQSRFIAYRQWREKRMEENKSYIPIIDEYGRIRVNGMFRSDPSDLEKFDIEKLDGSYEDFQDFLNRKVINGPASDPKYANDGFKKPSNSDVEPSDEELQQRETDQAELQKQLNKEANNTANSKTNTTLPDGTYVSGTITPEKTSWFDDLAKNAKSALEDGGSYAVFQVEYTGSISESFSNSTGEINTGGIIKSLAGKTRDLRFDLSGGNIGLGLNMDSVLGYAKDTVAGFLDGVTLGLSSIVTTILGDAYTTIPKKWNDSDMSLPQVSYTMKLRSPYGNTFAQLGSIYLPLAMLLAGTLPLATGRSSYTSPFLCSLYCQGVQNIKMGMITSLNITRGTSKLGFNKSKRPMGIDVTFTVTDFAELMSAPVNTSVFDKFKISYMDDSTFGIYMTTLCARDMNSNKYVKNKISNILNRFKSYFSEVKDPAKYGYLIGDTLHGIASPFVAQGNFTISTLGNKYF